MTGADDSSAALARPEGHLRLCLHLRQHPRLRERAVQQGTIPLQREGAGHTSVRNEAKTSSGQVKKTQKRIEDVLNTLMPADVLKEWLGR